MDFFNDIFHNLALLEFYFLNIIYILLYIDFILSIFFQHSNILTRASHHWCLASNIVLVGCVAQTKRPPFCRRHFQISFLGWNLFYCDPNFTEVCPSESIDNTSALVKVIAWRHTGEKQLSEPIAFWRTQASPGLGELTHGKQHYTTKVNSLPR